MKNKAVSHKKPQPNEVYFISNGSSETSVYTLSVKEPNQSDIPLGTFTSLKECRVFIANYILKNYNGTPSTVFNQLCQKPRRKKDVWDQWLVSQFL